MIENKAVPDAFMFLDQELSTMKKLAYHSNSS
jgi:hypothetical protein